MKFDSSLGKYVPVLYRSPAPGFMGSSSDMMVEVRSEVLFPRFLYYSVAHFSPVGPAHGDMSVHQEQPRPRVARAMGTSGQVKRDREQISLPVA